MAKALELCFGLPLFWGYLLSALVAIPLVTYGFTFLNRFQFWTQIVWVVLQAVPFIAIGAAGLMSLERLDGFPRPAGRGRWRFRSDAVRRRRRRGVCTRAAECRAGGFPALPAAPPRGQPCRLVDGSDLCRTGLDRAGHPENAGGLFSGRAAGQAGLRNGERRPAGADVSLRLRPRLCQSTGRHRPDRAVRGDLAAQDQRHQRLCRLAGLVQLLLPPDSQPSRPRGVGGVQCHPRLAADGAWHLSDAGTHAGTLFQHPGGLDGHHFCRSRHQQAPWPVSPVISSSSVPISTT